MLRTVTFLGVFLFAAIVSAEDRWTSLSNDGKTELEFDSQRPVTTGMVRRVWLRWTYTDAKKNAIGEIYLSQLDLTYVNCKDETLATPYSQVFTDRYGKGTVVRTQGKAADPDLKAYELTIPGTWGEQIVRWACGKT